MSNTGRDWTVLSMLEWATGYFENKQIPDPRLSIEWLLAGVLGVKRLDLYLQHDRPLSSDELNELRPLVKRRAAGEPLQYISGYTEFLNTTISVAPGVLIPRIETEQLVDLLLEQTRDRKNETIRLLDIGSGSGCIPVAIKKERPSWICCGLEISEDAIKIAEKNAEKNQVDVRFFHGDLLGIEDDRNISAPSWDIVISNPPYITPDEEKEIHRQVLEYEPRRALFHQAPQMLYRAIAAFASKKKAGLYLECNDKTTRETAQIVARFYPSVNVHKDLDGNDRFVVASGRLTGATP